MYANRILRLLSSAATIGLFAVSGCRGNESDLMPLEIGHTWNYIVKAGFETYVSPIKVAREISVANVRGFELTSNLGVARLAWTQDGLVTERLIGTQFVPPLPLLYKADETHERPWKGQVVFVDRGSPATATQSQAPDDELTYAGKKIHCIRSTVRLKTAAHKVELITWFSSGLGIVQQEQRTDERLLVRLTLLDQK